MALRGEGEERRCAVYIITARWHFEHRLDFNLSVAVVGGFDARWLTHPHFMLAFRYDHGGFCRDSAEILWGFFETFRARFSIFLWELFFFFLHSARDWFSGTMTKGGKGQLIHAIRTGCSQRHHAVGQGPKVAGNRRNRHATDSSRIIQLTLRLTRPSLDGTAIGQRFRGALASQHRSGDSIRFNWVWIGVCCSSLRPAEVIIDIQVR